MKKTIFGKVNFIYFYRNPDRNFDRSRVKGLVAELFTVTHNENTTG